MKLTWEEQLAEFASKCDELIAKQRAFANEIKGISRNLYSRSERMKDVAIDAAHSVKSGEMKAVVSEKLTKDEVDRKQAQKLHYNPVVVNLEKAVKKLKKHDKDNKNIVGKMKLRLTDLEKKVLGNGKKEQEIIFIHDQISKSHLEIESALKAHSDTLNSNS